MSCIITRSATRLSLPQKAGIGVRWLKMKRCIWIRPLERGFIQCTFIEALQRISVVSCTEGEKESWDICFMALKWFWLENLYVYELYKWKIIFDGHIFDDWRANTYIYIDDFIHELKHCLSISRTHNCLSYIFKWYWLFRILLLWNYFIDRKCNMQSHIKGKCLCL